MADTVTAPDLLLSVNYPISYGVASIVAWRHCL